MDITRIFTVICSFILIVCLTMCISTLVVLRNSIAEHKAVKEDAVELVESLDQSLESMKDMIDKYDQSVSVSVDSEKTNEQDAHFMIREVNGKIGVFTVDGVLLKVLEVSIDMLPQKDRELFADGITVGSWKELIAILQDFGE